MIIILLILLVLPLQSFAATYYVATTGNNSNNGDSTHEWKDPQKCALSPVVAGDTCIVRDGTYSVNASGGVGFDDNYTILIASNSPSGTSNNRITIKAENWNSAVIVIPATTSINAGFYVSKPYYTIQGFKVTDTSSGTRNTATSVHGFYLSGANGALIEHNEISQVGRGLCSNSTSGFTGVFDDGSDGAEVRYNVIHGVGRLFNGESGCSVTTSLNGNDHPFYESHAVNMNIHHNVVYDSDRGYCLNLYHSGSGSTYTHTNLKFIHNTCVHTPGETRGPIAQAIIGQTHPSGLTFTNNVFMFSDETCLIQTFNMGTVTSGVFKGNYSNFNDVSGDAFFCQSVPTGITVDGTNHANTTLGFTDSGSNDFTLTAASNLVDAGYNYGGAYNGSAPDPGAFETFVFSVCTVEDGDASNLRTTFTNNVNPPLRNIATTGFSSRQATVANALTSATLVGDSRIDFGLTAPITNGTAVDMSSTSGTVVTDSAMIGGTLNQKYVQILTNQSCTNNVGAGASHTFTQSRFEFHYDRGTESAPVMLPHGFASTGAAENFSSLKVMAGGAVRIRFALVCGGANCPATGFKLHYSTGGAYAVVPDDFDAGNVRFCGAGTDRPSNGAATTDQLSTAGTFVAGAFVSTSNAIPTVTLSNTNKTELEYCVLLDSDATGNYDFRVYQQDGTALNTYTVTPRIVASTPAAGGNGF